MFKVDDMSRKISSTLCLANSTEAKDCTTYTSPVPVKNRFASINVILNYIYNRLFHLTYLNSVA